MKSTEISVRCQFCENEVIPARLALGYRWCKPCAEFDAKLLQIGVMPRIFSKRPRQSAFVMGQVPKGK